MTKHKKTKKGLAGALKACKGKKGEKWKSCLNKHGVKSR